MSDQRYAFLFDAPDLAGASFPDSAPEDIDVEEYKPPTSRIQIAKLGSFKHPRYGSFKVTRDVFDGLIRNLTEVSGGQVPMDFDHEPDYGGSTRACGWIKKLEADGSKLMADVEWTWQAAYSIKEREYLYISPTWVLDYTDEAGEKKGPVLLGAALTNRPFFERMAVVTCSQSFSRDDLTLAVEDPASDPKPSPDSRPRSPMTDFLKQIAAVFSLAEDATEDQVLTAAHAALAKQIPADHIVVTAARITELERAAKVPPGHTVIAASVLEELEGKASRADRFAAELGETKFETAFAAALSEGKVIPTEKDGLRQVFDQNADLVIDMLRERLPVVITSARGDSGHVPGDAPEGSDPESYALDRKVQAYMRDKGMTPDQYPAALDHVMAQEGMI